jgi:aminopeptidase N
MSLAARALLPFTLAAALGAQTATMPKSPSAAAPTNPGRGAQSGPAAAPATPKRAEVLRGAYGPFRANNDLLSYGLEVRVDPVAKTIAGKNAVRFRMLTAGTRIQLDLTEDLAVDKILLHGAELKYTREAGAVFVEFPETLKVGQTVAIDFFFSGKPVSKGRFGGMSFEKDAAGRPWIFTADEDDGCEIWFPCKDQWKDEPQEGMTLSVAVPDGLMDVSNGRFEGSKSLGDGYTQWNWRVHYPINSYDVALNIGDYQHFGETYKGLSLDFYALPEDLNKAKVQFAQAKGMLDAFTHYFGPYPFAKDGYKLVQVPYAGMEHQSAVAYGNQFENGYLKRDWTGVGISPRFDFIIIHESGHEWFGNSITAADRSDMWIHEGWTTYLETLYVEYRWGKDDALKYISGLVPKVRNRTPILTEPGVAAEPPQDMYFKGALMIATLRSMLDDDARWFRLLRQFYDRFAYTTTSTDAVIAWWKAALGPVLKFDLTPFFNQYLRRTAIPALELNFDEADGLVMYKWQAEEPGFTMPVEVGSPGHWVTIRPTREWKWMQTSIPKSDFQVRTYLFFVNVSKT